jgi:hypothetical protein
MSQIDPEVRLTHDLLQEYSSARQEWAKQATEDNEFRNGNQWKDSHAKSLKQRAQEPVVVNVVHSAVEQAKALLTTNKPRFQSTGRENSDVKTGRIFSDIMAYIWDNSNGNVQLKQAVDDYYVKGMGTLFVSYDPNEDFGKGEIKISAINPHDIYIDPNSQDPFCQDASNIIIGKKHMRSQLVSAYPQYAEIINEATVTNYLPTEIASKYNSNVNQVTPTNGQQRFADKDEELEAFERLTKVKVKYMRAYNPMLNREDILNEEDYVTYLLSPAYKVITQQGENYETELNAVNQIEAMVKEFGTVWHMVQDMMTGQPVPVSGPESANMIPESTTIVDRLSFKDLIDQGVIKSNVCEVNHVECCFSVGDKMLYKAVYPVEHYPLIPIMNRHNRNPYPISDVRLVKGLQEYINKIRSLIIAHASSSTNVKLLIPRGSMDKNKLEQEWGRAGTAVIEYDPELGQPIVAGPVPLPNELYKNEADAKADIERILGIYALMQGDQGSAPQTYKGTVAMDEFGQRRIKSKKDDVESALNQMARVVIAYVQAYYTSDKTMRLIHPNAAPSEIQINKDIYDPVTGAFLERLNDVTVGKYDIICVSGSTLPSNRWGRFEYYMQLYAQGIIDQVEVLKQTDVADMEGVLERADQRNQMSSQINGLTEEIKKLKGDLQTAQRESLHDRKRVELKDFEKKLAKAEAKIEMAAKLYDARSKDELGKIKEAVKDVTSESDSQSSQSAMNAKLLGLK